MSRFQLRCALLSMVMAGSAVAQAPAPATPADLSDAERAKRDADKVFQWIRIHSDKPRKSAAAAPADKPPAVAPRSATRAARAPDSNGETVRELPAAPRQDTASRPAEPPPAAATANTGPAVAVDASAPQVTATAAVEEDVALMPVVKTEPEFSGALMRQLRKGLVQVGFTVKPDGSVTQVHAVSSTHPRLVATAVSTVAQWKFQPLRHPQQAVVDLGFNLD